MIRWPPYYCVTEGPGPPSVYSKRPGRALLINSPSQVHFFLLPPPPIQRWTRRHSLRRPHQPPSCHRYARSLPASVPLHLELTPLISGIPTLFTPAAHTAPPTYTIPDALELTRIPREYHRRDFHRWFRNRPNSNACYVQSPARLQA